MFFFRSFFSHEKKTEKDDSLSENSFLESLEEDCLREEHENKKESGYNSVNLKSSREKLNSNKHHNKKINSNRHHNDNNRYSNKSHNKIGSNNRDRYNVNSSTNKSNNYNDNSKIGSNQKNYNRYSNNHIKSSNFIKNDNSNYKKNRTNNKDHNSYIRSIKNKHDSYLRGNKNNNGVNKPRFILPTDYDKNDNSNYKKNRTNNKDHNSYIRSIKNKHDSYLRGNKPRFILPPYSDKNDKIYRYDRNNVFFLPKAVPNLPRSRQKKIYNSLIKSIKKGKEQERKNRPTFGDKFSHMGRYNYRNWQNVFYKYNRKHHHNSSKTPHYPFLIYSVKQYLALYRSYNFETWKSRKFSQILMKYYLGHNNNVANKENPNRFTRYGFTDSYTLHNLSVDKEDYDVASFFRIFSFSKHMNRNISFNRSISDLRNVFIHTYPGTKSHFFSNRNEYKVFRKSFYETLLKPKGISVSDYIMFRRYWLNRFPSFRTITSSISFYKEIDLANETSYIEPKYHSAYMRFPLFLDYLHLVARLKRKLATFYFLNTLVSLYSLRDVYYKDNFSKPLDFLQNKILLFKRRNFNHYLAYNNVSFVKHYKNLTSVVKCNALVSNTSLFSFYARKKSKHFHLAHLSRSNKLRLYNYDHIISYTNALRSFSMGDSSHLSTYIENLSMYFFDDGNKFSSHDNICDRYRYYLNVIKNTKLMSSLENSNNTFKFRLGNKEPVSSSGSIDMFHSRYTIYLLNSFSNLFTYSINKQEESSFFSVYIVKFVTFLLKQSTYYFFRECLLNKYKLDVYRLKFDKYFFRKSKDQETLTFFNQSLISNKDKKVLYKWNLLSSSKKFFQFSYLELFVCYRHILKFRVSKGILNFYSKVYRDKEIEAYKLTNRIHNFINHCISNKGTLLFNLKKYLSSLNRRFVFRSTTEQTNEYLFLFLKIVLSKIFNGLAENIDLFEIKSGKKRIKKNVFYDLRSYLTDHYYNFVKYNHLNSAYYNHYFQTFNNEGYYLKSDIINIDDEHDTKKLWSDMFLNKRSKANTVLDVVGNLFRMEKGCLDSYTQILASKILFKYIEFKDNLFSKFSKSHYLGRSFLKRKKVNNYMECVNKHVGTGLVNRKVITLYRPFFVLLLNSLLYLRDMVLNSQTNYTMSKFNGFFLIHSYRDTFIFAKHLFIGYDDRISDLLQNEIYHFIKL